MRNRWAIFSSWWLILSLMLLACAPTATPKPTPPATPAPSPTLKSAVTPAPSPTPTSKPASAPAAAGVSFAGKTVTIVVGAGAGGSTDILGRLYAKYLPKYLPGNPVAIVRNMPGGDGTIGANFAYSSKPDGLTAYVMGAAPAMADLLDKPALKFSSFTEMTAAIAIPSSDLYFFKVGLFEKPEDVVKSNGIIYGGMAGANTIIFACTKEFVGVPTDKVIVGYPSSSDALRAFHAGEINGMGVASLQYDANVRPYLERGEVRILFQSGTADEAGGIVRDPGLPSGILTGKEISEKIHGKPPSGMAYEAYKSIIISVKSTDKALLLPPGTPDGVKAAYWAATSTMVRDPDFVKISEPLVGAGAKWLVGEAFDKMFRKEFGLKPDVRDWLRDFMSTKYGVVID